MLYSRSLLFILCIAVCVWRRQWHPTPVLLPGKSHGWRSLVGYSPWCRWGLDTTERLHFHFSLSCTGEGNGNPLQCSCLKNPRDGGAWWAAIYGVAQSRTLLKWLSSSSSSVCKQLILLKHAISWWLMRLSNISYVYWPLGFPFQHFQVFAQFSIARQWFVAILYTFWIFANFVRICVTNICSQFIVCF